MLERNWLWNIAWLNEFWILHAWLSRMDLTTTYLNLHVEYELFSCCRKNTEVIILFTFMNMHFRLLHIRHKGFQDDFKLSYWRVVRACFRSDMMLHERSTGSGWCHERCSLFMVLS